jgi:hypothetical protein
MILCACFQDHILPLRQKIMVHILLVKHYRGAGNDPQRCEQRQDYTIEMKYLFKHENSINLKFKIAANLYGYFNMQQPECLINNDSKCKSLCYSRKRLLFIPSIRARNSQPATHSCISPSGAAAGNF